MDNLHKLLKEIETFSNSAFGTPQVRNETATLRKLKAEIDELIENPNDKHEWADVFLLLLDAARRKGYTINDLISFGLEKIEINKNRTWKKF